MGRLLKAANRRLIRPLSDSPDDQRREYIFNILIGFVTFAAFAATLSSGITHLLGANAHKANSVPSTMLFLLFSAGLWWLSRRGRYKLGAYVLTGLLLLASLQLAMTWSIELPMAELLTVLVIIISGLVISSRAVIVTTVIVSAWTLFLGYAQTSGTLSADTSWLTKRLEFSDAIGLVVIYGIVGAIAWLANNEIDSLLRRAWRSEKALAKERDQLEVTVAERTRELEQAQLDRTLEMQHFAEFGRVSAGLVHDVSAPLTAASLNLEQIGDDKSSELISEALASLHHIESYISSARKQLQGESKPTKFLASKVVTEVINLLQYQARSAKVNINATVHNERFIFGDPVVFHRVVANLIMNAMDAYAKSRRTERVVEIDINAVGESLIVDVHDAGSGIAAHDLPHIFENFYSTKKRAGRGLGLGLASAKQSIEEQFKGSLQVKSSPKQGTTFTIGIPFHEQSHSKKYTKRT